MREKIGKITLDYTHYPGQDFYCDGDVEDELLDIVKNHPPRDFPGLIEERAKWPVLYHLSPLRENIVDWIPMDKETKVLEIGSGCGAVTGKLAQKAGSVTSIDLSRKRCLINACRHRDCGNVTIHVGNFKDIEPDLPEDFDYICFIGVFEYAQSYIDTADPYVDWLRMMRRHLKKDGRIIIAIENRLGLKYFAGCCEDHLGNYFSGIEDYAGGGGVRTFVRSRLEQMLRKSGFDRYSFYYPYPDYKFMSTLYSDERLPKQGELHENLRNFDRDRLLLFDEKQAYDGMIRDGLFPVFSNSYLVVAGEDLEVKYARYSNDRAEDYAIRTEIRGQGGGRIVRKYPLSGEAYRHVQRMEDSCRELSLRFEGSGLEINSCRLAEGGAFAEFEYVEAHTLEEILDGYLVREDVEGFYALFDEYLRRISHREEAAVADYDLIFANILIQPKSGSSAAGLKEIREGRWTVIDYEWTFRRRISAREIAFRAVYCYLLEDERRSKLDMDRMLTRLGLTRQEAEALREQEMEFQKQVTGNRKALGEIREALGNRVIRPGKWLRRLEDVSLRERVQVYEDRGEGYKEEESYFISDAYEEENLLHLSLEIDGKVESLRIDPAMDCCAVRIREIRMNGSRVDGDRRSIVTNGKKLGEGSYVFDTEDPNINIRVSRYKRQERNSLEAVLEIVRLPGAMAADLCRRKKIP
ncbi:MAG: class I SAM-dependent methyltransferase [Lachnospiraceae bacterium]|nr:class I SAM-dependent methyltransferase [Lachnospiraceae bacterium]